MWTRYLLWREPPETPPPGRRNKPRLSLPGYCCTYLKVSQYYYPPPTSATYMRQWIGSALVQIMSFRLFGTKPLSKPMLGYCQLLSNGPLGTNFNEILIEIRKFHSRKCIWKYCLWSGGHLVQGGDKLKMAVTWVIYIPSLTLNIQRSFCARAQPMRDDATL